MLSYSRLSQGFMDIYGRFVYEDNLIQRRYSDTKKALITTPSSTPISTAFFSNNVIQDFQENSDDEVDERSSEEYLRDLDSSSNSNNQADSKFQKDYKAEYKNMKAKLALLKENPSSSQNPKFFQPKNKGLVVEAFYWDEEEVSDEEEVTQVKVLMALADDELTVGKSHVRNGEWVNITIRKLNHALQEQLKEEKRINEKWLTSSKKVIQCISEQIPHQKKKVLGRELFIESSSKMNEIENLFVPASIGYDQEMVLKTKDWVERLNPDSKLPNFNESLEPTETLNTPESSKDSEAESLTPLPPLKNLEGALPSSKATPLTFQPHSPRERLGLGTMKHTKPETHDSSNKYVSKTVTGSKTKQTTPSVPTEVKVTKQESKLNELTKLVQMIIDEKIRGGVLAESSQSNESLIGVRCNICGSIIHSTSDHNEFDHFKRDTSRSPSGTWIVDAQGVLLASRVICTNINGLIAHIEENDVYVLDMSSLTPNGACFFAKASESVNWLWHKRLSHLNFKNINKLAKQNKVLGLPSLVYSKDKPCTTCEKGKHHRASFKTKQNFSIRKCLHLLHMDLFGPVSPMSINHEKYTLVIVDEYSRYTWVYFLRKKSQAPEMIMSFIRMVENQNDVKVKQIRTDNGTEFRNHELESFCDEKGISQNFSSPYTPEQNGVAERKNRTLIEAARTMLNGSVLSKHFWTDAVRIACYTQNRSIIVKRHDKTPYEIFRERIPDISYFHVFGCPVFIHNHKDHLGKFDAKADDGYFLGYSFVSKAFRVFNTRRQQVEETYHVTFDEMIAPNEPEIPHTEDTKGPPDLINTEGTHEQNVQNDQMITQPTDMPSGNNTEVLGSITEPLVPDVTQSHISNQASTSSHHVPQDRWSRDQHIELVNIIGDHGEVMLTRSMAAKLTAASASECLFTDFLSKIEPKKASKALKHP
ncbi:retrovirus-related pol polyprotein from transposon TNT 1-94 [Tanacetum coccineum]